LRLLMDSAERLHSAADEAELAKAVTTAVVEGSSFTRAALVREADGFARVELLAVNRRGGGDGASMPISRSLLSAARAGEVVQLESRPNLREAMSIVGAGVQQAICAPVQVGPAVDAFLYADCEERASGEDPEGSSFVSALARICGLALSGLRRSALEREQRDMMRELTGAREVQRRMMPPARGSAGPLRFAFANMPGRVVAGDIGGVADLSGGRAALFIGDVTGKGLGPSLLMASTQSYLRAALATTDDPIALVSGVNDYLASTSAENEFASLWFAIAGPGPRLRCVDAGHGLAILVRRGAGSELLRTGGGVPIGVSTGMPYASTELTLSPGDRLVLFSDGVKEQQGTGGEEFGVPRISKILEGTNSCERDVEALFRELREYAGGDSFADDVTVASFELA
jgi:serine phosphatase RsbU (regulator of sigma subunit)